MQAPGPRFMFSSGLAMHPESAFLNGVSLNRPATAGPLAAGSPLTPDGPRTFEIVTAST